MLTPEEREDIEAELAAEQKGIKPVKNYREAFRNKKVIALCAQYFLWSIGVYGFMMWLPSILKSAPDMDIVTTGWLSSVPYLLAIIGMVTASYFSDNCSIAVILSGRSSSLVPLPSMVRSSSQLELPNLVYPARRGRWYDVCSYGPFFAFIPEMLPVNVAGGAMALINSFGALGSFVGAFLVGLLNSYTGDYGASYLFMACSLLIASGITYRVFSVKKSTKEGALIANDHDLSARA